MSIRERRRRRRRRNKQANENTNIHYEYTHDKWCTVAYLKKHVENKVNDSTKQQQTQNRERYREWERERQIEVTSVLQCNSSSAAYVQVDVVKISALAGWTTRRQKRRNREYRSRIVSMWNLPVVVTLMRGFCFRRNTLRCFSTLTNALLRLKKTFWHSRIRSFRWTIRSSPARLLSRMRSRDNGCHAFGWFLLRSRKL